MNKTRREVTRSAMLVSVIWLNTLSRVCNISKKHGAVQLTDLAVGIPVHLSGVGLNVPSNFYDFNDNFMILWWFYDSKMLPNYPSNMISGEKCEDLPYINSHLIYFSWVSPPWLLLCPARLMQTGFQSSSKCWRVCTYIDDAKWFIKSRDRQLKHELELGHQNMDGCSSCEATD